MKTIRLLFVLGFSIAAAQAAEKEVKLLGVTSGFGVDSAVFGIWDVARNASQIEILKAGQGIDGPGLISSEPVKTEAVELVRIEAAKGAASVTVNGEMRHISMAADQDSTNELDSSLPVMYFQTLPLRNAITLYGDYKKRTVLIHPKLEPQTFSLKINPRTRQEAVEALEKLFHDHNIATIPDGEHFVMLVPVTLTNSVRASSSGLPHTNSLVPAMSINFTDAPIGLAIQTYADFMHKEVVNMQDNSVPLWHTITLIQSAPLSRTEIGYALETLIEWNNIRMAPDGNDKLKLEKITGR